MRFYKVGLFLLILGFLLGWLHTRAATAIGQGQLTVIDFETPALGALARGIFSPYQPNEAVTFTTAISANSTDVVGLVKNNATSVCAEPADANQKFGSGRSNFSDGAIGYGTAAIRATFAQPLAPPHLVAVDFQTGAGLPVRLRLFDAAGVEVAAITENATASAGTCGLPGQPRARHRLTLRADQPVAAAVMDLGSETGRFVFTIDNFTFGPAAVDEPTPEPGQGQSDLALIAASAPPPLTAGERFTYTLHLTNRGPHPAPAVVLTSTLTSEFTLLHITADEALCETEQQALVCTMAPLAVNAGVQLQLTLAAHAERSGKSVTLTATVQDQSNTDPMPTNNRVTTVLAVTSARVVRGLQALYTFVEKDATVIHDLSGTGAPLDVTIYTPTQVQPTLTGLQIIAPTLMMAPAAQKVRQAIVATGELSVEAWLVPAPSTAAVPAHLLTLASTDGALFTLLQEPYATQAAGLYTAQLATDQAPTGSRLSAAPISNPAGQPLHLVYTRTAAGLARLYLNGTARATKAMAGHLQGWAGQPTFYLAADVTGEQPWLGELQLVALYDRALDAAEVQQNYRNGPHGDSPTEGNETGDDDLFGYDYEVWVDPATPSAQTPVELGVVVHRLAGKAVLSDVGVRFYLGDPAQGAQRIGDAVVERLSPRSSALSTDVTWTPPAEGVYSIYVQLDPEQRIAERDESNNGLLRTVTVRSATTAPDADLLAPHVDAFTINDNQSSTSSRDVQLAVTLSDPIPTAGIDGVAFIEYGYAPEAGAWRIVQSSAWLSYTTAPTHYPWQLQATPGLKYIQAWAKDKAGNIALFPYTRYINYAPPLLQVEQASLQVLRFAVQAGDRLTVRLTAVQGDPDLYLWPPDYQEGRPPWVSNLRGGVDVVSLTAPVAGNYQIEIYGFTFAAYQLQIIQEPAARLISDEGGIDPSKTRFTQPSLKLTSAPSASQGLLLLAAQGYKTFLPFIR